MNARGGFAARRALSRFRATVRHASTEVIAFIHLQARSGSREPRGIAQPLPANIVIGPPRRLTKYFAVSGEFGELSANTL